ncbi:MAG: hypothetical protein ACE5L6_04675 [Candidatus Bathyarchaeia archaeon]
MLRTNVFAMTGTSLTINDVWGIQALLERFRRKPVNMKLHCDGSQRADTYLQNFREAETSLVFPSPDVCGLSLSNGGFTTTGCGSDRCKPEAVC